MGMRDNRTFLPRVAAAILIWSLAAAGQASPVISGSEPASILPDPASTLKVDVRLVPVHVVVRDAHGLPVGNLTKEDFKVFDQGKEQAITQFSLERADGQGARSNPLGTTSTPPAPPVRFTAYLFDDLHLERNDLMRAREAALRQLAAFSPSVERAAILTTSGRVLVDFTADVTKLRDTLAHLEPPPKLTALDCPAMTYYMADLIDEKGDRTAMEIARDEAVECAFAGDVALRPQALKLAEEVARQKIEIGKVETLSSLRILKALVRGMSAAPGRRMVIIISPGFFIPEREEQAEIMDLAVRFDVTVSALDPRGLIPRVEDDPRKTIYFVGAEAEDADILEGLADSTGGVFFHYNNDVEEGFRRTAATPEYSYTLAFSPGSLKLNGHFHRLKVKVNGDAKLRVQARKGYYAPKKP